MDLDLENPPCPLCDGLQRVRLHAFAPFEVVRCVSCGVHYLCPRLAEAAMRRSYADDHYFEGGRQGYADVSYGDQARALQLTFGRFVRNLARRGFAGGALLEVGCGYGYLLEAARGFFDTREGTEYSPGALEKARQVADRVYEGGLDAVPAGQGFDCIIATQVIEHIYRPREFMQSVRARLKRGGWAVIATPDMGSPWRRLFGRRWPSFKVPEHVVFYDRRILARLLREAGFEGVTVVPYPHAFPLGLIGSKLNLRIGPRLRNLSVWIPGTTLALCGMNASHD